MNRFILLTFVWSGILLLAATLLDAPVCRAETVRATYSFAVDEPENIADTGTVWLYHYSWYGLHKFRLADIVNGEAHLELSQDRLDNDIQPHINTDAFIIVIELPSSNWYRTPDILPAELLDNAFTALDSLGTVEYRSGGAKLLLLPAPVKHLIALKDQNGEAITNLDVPVSIYVYDQNHCGRHMGINLGTYSTNPLGEITFLAPTVPLYFNIFYYEPAGQGFAGQMFESNFGLKIAEEPAQGIQIGWNFPSDTLRFHVQRPDGTPVANLSLESCILSGECGGHCGSLWKTDIDGDAEGEFTPQILQSISFRSEMGQEYRLSDEELAKLFMEKSLTVIWDN